MFRNFVNNKDGATLIQGCEEIIETLIEFYSTMFCVLR